MASLQASTEISLAVSTNSRPSIFRQDYNVTSWFCCAETMTSQFFHTDSKTFRRPNTKVSDPVANLGPQNSTLTATGPKASAEAQPLAYPAPQALTGSSQRQSMAGTCPKAIRHGFKKAFASFFNSINTFRVKQPLATSLDMTEIITEISGDPHAQQKGSVGPLSSVGLFLKLQGFICQTLDKSIERVLPLTHFLHD